MVWCKRDRYYADIDITDGAFLSEKAMHWEQLTSKLVQDADIQVSRAVKTWNNVIRDHLRDEMGFRLSTGKNRFLCQSLSPTVCRPPCSLSWVIPMTRG